MLIAFGAVACGDDDEEPTPTAVPTSTPAPPTAMSFMDNSFSPNTLTARAGQLLQINLKNDGQRPHTFTIDGVVDSGRLESGATGSVQFTPSQAGTLTYYCTVHGRDRMNGTLTVSAGAVTEPSSPSAPAGASSSY
jgi:plastocyanin